MAGFTTLRDLGTEGAGYADLSVQRAIEEGRIPGRRLFVATLAIVATASYGPGPRGFAPEFVPPKGAQEASGVAEILRAVREQVGHGADWVKVYADYRRGPGGTAVPTFSLEELKALVEESHSAGRPVAAHATTPEGMRRATLAGVQTIEHGYGGTAEVFKLMAERGVALLPTLAADEAYAEYFQGYERGRSAPTADMELARRAFQIALENGVVVGCGSDVGVFAHGDNFRELEWMVKNGMTRVPGAARRHRDQRPDPGAGRPLRPDPSRASSPTWWPCPATRPRDIRALEDVRFVMKEGRVYKQP